MNATGRETGKRHRFSRSVLWVGGADPFPYKILLRKFQVLKRVGRWDQAMETLSPAVAAVEGVDRGLQAEALEQLGNLNLIKGQVEQAKEMLPQALSLFRELGDQRGEGKVLGDLGTACRNRGEFQEAEDLYRRQMMTAKLGGERAEIGLAAENLANLFLYKGDLDRALEYFDQSMRIAESTRDRVAYCTLMLNKGNVYYYREDFPKAEECYRRSLEESKALGYKANMGLVLGALGNCFVEQGNMKMAREAYTSCLIINQELGNKIGRAKAMGSLGMLEIRLRRDIEAIDYLEESLAIFESINDKQDEAVTLNLVAQAYLNLGRTTQAAEKLDRALAIAREIKLSHYLPQFMQKRAELCFELEEIEKSDLLCREARVLAEAAGRKEVVFDCEILGCKLLARYDIQAAVERFREMLLKTENERQAACLYYELFKLTGSDDDRIQALSKCRKLFEDGQWPEWAERIMQLENPPE